MGVRAICCTISLQSLSQSREYILLHNFSSIFVKGVRSSFFVREYVDTRLWKLDFSRYARMKILLSVLILLSFREIAGREISDKQTTSSSERHGAAFLVMGEVRSEVALRGMHTGSAPPSCVAKCEGCNPCKPLQCAVTPKLQCIPKRVEDYYPVLWKCGCGNKVFNP